MRGSTIHSVVVVLLLLLLASLVIFSKLRRKIYRGRYVSLNKNAYYRVRHLAAKSLKNISESKAAGVSRSQMLAG